MTRRTTVIFDDEVSEALAALMEETHMTNVSDVVRASITVFRGLVRADAQGKKIYLRDLKGNFWHYSPHRKPTGPRSLVKVSAAEVLGQQKARRQDDLAGGTIQHGSL